MKLEQTEKSLLFSETAIPDIFFADFLSQTPGDFLKIYMYMIFFSKFHKEIKINDISKKLDLPLKTINDGLIFLENNNLILKKGTGYIMVDLQESTLNKLYMPNLVTTPEKIEENSNNKALIKAIEHINNKYFSGIMSPSWYSDIDLWFTKYGFDDQVMITLFDYCFNRSALHKNYVQTVGEAWHNSNVKTWNDLDLYFEKQEKMNKLKKSIAKKLGKQSGLTQYEEAYIEKWVFGYGYDLSIIELALQRSTLKAAPTFEYFNKILTDWHDHNLKSPAEVEEFLAKWKKQEKDVKNLQKQVSKASFDQRQYSNLEYLYANNIKGESNVL